MFVNMSLFNRKQCIHSETLTSQRSLETHVYKHTRDFNKKEKREVAAESRNLRPQTEGSNKSWIPSFLHIEVQMAAKKKQNKW